MVSTQGTVTRKRSFRSNRTPVTALAVPTRYPMMTKYYKVLNRQKLNNLSHVSGSYLNYIEWQIRSLKTKKFHFYIQICIKR